MKTHLKENCRRWLLAVFGLLLLTIPANAATSVWDSENFFKLSFNPELGCIDVYVVGQLDELNDIDGQGWSEDGWLNIYATVGNDSEHLMAKFEGPRGNGKFENYPNVENWVKKKCSGLTVTSHKSDYGSGDESTNLYALTFHYPVPADSKSVTIRLDGYWYVKGHKGDHEVKLSKNISYSFNLSSVNVSSKNYTNDEKGSYSIQWNSSGSANCDKYSTIGLYDAEGELIENVDNNPVKGSAGSGTFIVKGKDVNTSETYYLKRIYDKGKGKISKTSDVYRNPYPQVSDTPSISFDRENLKANVSFEISEAPKDAYDDRFKVLTKVFNTTTNAYVDSYTQESTVFYKSNTTNYSCGVNIPAEGDYKVEITVGRAKAFNWNNWDDYKQSASSVYENHHYCIKNVTAEKGTDGQSVKLEWNYDAKSNFWSNGSALKVRRYVNKNFGSYQEFVIGNSVNKKSWIDEELPSGQGYTYELQVVPTSSKYTAKEFVRTANEIVFPKQGSISYVKSSKGYYPDGVELKWGAVGKFKKFKISRSIYKEGSADNFTFVSEVNGTSAVNGVFSYKDKNTVPGVIYKYKLSGDLDSYPSPVKIDYPKEIFGFSTATGNVEGCVTYANGQGVPDVDMRLSSDERVSRGYSVKLSNALNDYLKTNDSLSLTNQSLTFQMLARPQSEGNGYMIEFGKYRLGLKSGVPYFSNGVDEVHADNALAIGRFTSVSAGCRKGADGDTLFLVIHDNNNVKVKTVKKSSSSVGEIKQNLLIGRAFGGNIDEVRVWNKGLTDKQIEENHNSYLSGGEEGLVAYYRFNDAIRYNFFDLSHENGVYHEKHGKILGSATYDDAIVPTSSELAFSDKTDERGNYRIVGVPYEGVGSSYTLTPVKGIHKFKYGSAGSEQGSTTFTIGESNRLLAKDFTDISSFTVSGVVYYTGTSVPVKGAQFMIDGKYAMNAANEMVVSDENGVYSINVPIGVHQVKALKNQHVFVNDGKLQNDDQTDVNFQDNMSEVIFWDDTKVKLIGRIVGGDVEANKPEGHSQSHNNLGSKISMTLALAKTGPRLSTEGLRTDTVKHFKANRSNLVVTDENDIKVYMDTVTGEYVAYLIPERFQVTSLNISGFAQNFADEINNRVIDLTNKLQLLPSVSTTVPKEGEVVDTVYYNEIFSHNKLNEPTYSFKEVFVSTDDNGAPVYSDKGFFGNEYEFVSTFNESGASVSHKVVLYDGKKYTFGKPIYKSKGLYNILVSAYKEYFFNNDPKQGVDKVPVINGSVKVENTMRDSICTIPLDTAGHALYSFRPNNPDVANSDQGVRKVEFTLTANERTYTSKRLEGIVLGSKGTGANFVTDGPTKLLMVLRDPPGSHSYSVTSESVSLREGYSQNVSWTVNDDITAKFLGGYSIEQSVGAPGAEIVTEVMSGENNVGTVIRNQVDGQDELTGTYTYTFDSQFQTSDDPDFVGRDADLLIGNSTNVVMGTMNTLGFKPINQLSSEEQGKKIAEYGGFALCVNKSISAEEKFATMFAYPQVHIENVLIPQCDELIGQLLEKGRGLNENQAKAKANQLNEPIYVPHFEVGHDNYGRSNPKGADLDLISGRGTGEYYDIYFPDQMIKKFRAKQVDLKDSLLSLEISRENWVKLLRENERQKVEAFKNVPAQNLSYQGGALIEQTITYESENVKTTSNTTQITAGLLTEIEATASKIGGRVETTMENTDVEGDGKESGETKTTTISFVLADDGEDYMSVDVYKPKTSATEGGGDDIKSSGFIFRLRGGATSGPFEGVQYTKYFEPGKHKISEGSLLVEKPVISVAPATVANVPSNKPAVFTLKMYNESEAQRDCIFDLKLMDSSNAKGAKFSIDGVALGSGRPFEVPYGDILTKKLEVMRGAEDFDYEDMKLILVSQTQNDPFSNNGVIADTINLSAHFVPASTELHLKNPGNGWTMNVRSESDDKGYYMPVLVDGFDVNDPKFDRIEVLYKPTSEPKQWTTLRTFYKDENRKLERPEEEEYIGNKTILVAKFTGDQDQSYDIKAVSYTRYGEEFVTAESEVATGVKDTQRPQLFGLPTPANGILSVSDVIGLTFNEPIAGGYLSRDNFEITAVKNGSKSDRSVSVKMDGVKDAVVSEFGKDWSNRNLTVNGWVKFEDLTAEQCIFALGEPNNGCTLKYMGQQGKFNFSANDGKSFNLNCVANKAPFEAGQWYNIAAVIDYDAELVTLYLNFTEIGVEEIVSEFKCDGKVFLGSDCKGLNHFKGYMDDFRIWDKTMDFSDIKTTADRCLSGAEPSLIAYYPMDEARGEVVLDKARGNNARLTGEWSTPNGFAVLFDGKDDMLVINSGNVAVKPSQDFTLEFWFKTNDQTQDATLLCNGSADGADLDDNKGMLRVGFEKGQLMVRTAGNAERVAGTYNDKNWHHFLLTVNRIGGYAQVYMDEKLVHYFDADKVGGFAGAQLYVGARRYDVASAEVRQTLTDQYFSGAIDEIRLWANSFTQSSVENNGNKLLKGNEMGLMAYYPFDEWIVNTFNIRELVASLKEMVDKKEVAVAEGGALNAKTAHAPLVDGGVAEPVAYEFVANKEGLILNLTEPEERIDNTILNIAVTRVLDVNGNAMDGVVRWSAFVDRNPIRWADAKKDVQVQQGEAAEFTLALNNTSGVVKNYNLEGMPAWLEVTPAVGKIEPNAAVDVHFEISAGANVGTYDEMIYARGDNNVAAALPLKVKVNGKKPDWKLNAGKYEHNMSIFGQMYFDGALSNDKEDIVAVFRDGECVGLSNSEYDKVRDMWYTYITVYSKEIPAVGNDLKDLYEFRMWDAGTGQIYAGQVKSLVFNNGICGSLANLVEIAGQEIKIRDLNLMEGWNWVSFAVLPEAATSNSVLKNGKWQKDDVIKNASLFDSYSVQNGKWEGTLGNAVERTKMYMLRTAVAQSLNVEGTEDAQATVRVEGKKWNYIGYTPKYNLTVKEAMAGYRAEEGDVLKSQTQFAMFTEGGWVGSLKYMEVNKGYMLYRNAEGNADFVYPAIRGAYSNKMHAPMVTFAAPMAEQKYANNLTIVAKPAYADLQEGDIIKAYVNGELRGYSQVVNRDDVDLHFLTIAGSEEGENIVFSLERNGEEVAKSATVVPFAANAAFGSVTKALEISFDEADDNVRVYPNPFVSYLNIQFFAEQAGKAEISVYDLSGRLIMFKTLEAQAGVNKYTWNGVTNQAAPCAGGVHLVRVTVNGKTTVHEVIKK